jgi:hypothetical protein
MSDTSILHETIDWWAVPYSLAHNGVHTMWRYRGRMNQSQMCVGESTATMVEGRLRMLWVAAQVLEDLMPPMIEEVVQKTVDKVFPPPEGTTLPGPTLNTFVKLDL